MCVRIIVWTTVVYSSLHDFDNFRDLLDGDIACFWAGMPVARWTVAPQKHQIVDLKAFESSFQLFCHWPTPSEVSRESFQKTFEPFDKWIKADKRKEICSIEKRVYLPDIKTSLSPNPPKIEDSTMANTTDAALISSPSPNPIIPFRFTSIHKVLLHVMMVTVI